MANTAPSVSGNKNYYRYIDSCSNLFCHSIVVRKPLVMMVQNGVLHSNKIK